MADYSFPIEPQEHIGLAWKFANMFSKKYGGEATDHVGASMEGIICAARSFNSERLTDRKGASGYEGLRYVRFSTYATRACWNHMNRQYFIGKGMGHNGDRQKLKTSPIIDDADRSTRPERRKVNRERLLAVLDTLTTETQRTALLAHATGPMRKSQKGKHQRSMCNEVGNAAISLHVRNMARTLAIAGITREWFYEE